MKVVVTGGAGFIGSHLVDAMVNAGHAVQVLDNLSTGSLANLGHISNKIEFHECDLSIPGNWEDVFDKADWVFHLAALADIVPSIQNPRAYFESNVDGTFNVLQASRRANVGRFIYAASSSCYGIPEIYPTPESSPLDPKYPYALTKKMGEDLVMHWAKIYKLPAISLRFFNVYGTRSRTAGTYGAVLGVFLAQKLAGRPFTVVGDGAQRRDFTYVTDVVSAIVTAASSARVGEIYNVGSGEAVSVNALVGLLGGDITYIDKRPGEPDLTFADIVKIRNELNWMPSIPIEEGIKRVLEDIEYWRAAPVWTPESIKEATVDWFKYLK